MYNDLIAIKMLAERVIAEIGWNEMIDRRIPEMNVHNLIRGIIRPSDDFSEANQRRIINEAVTALRRIYPIKR